MNTQPTNSRRGLIFGALALAGVAWGWQRFGVGTPSLVFSPMPGVSNWEMAQAGGLTPFSGSASNAVFLGIGDEQVTPLPEDRLCSVLYRRAAGTPKVAVFTDFFCPNCRALDARLAARKDISIAWHEIPLLGPNSEFVAKALVAADLQGGYLALKARLLQAPFRPSPGTISQAAFAAGLDGERVVLDMNGPEVHARLQESKAASERLGIWGTPAIATGRKLIMGAVPNDALSLVLESTGRCTP